ncbi:hypothetical protein EVAR_35319_1 [Eumeta japonica]|uniref:Mariner Mos1 transposase n=1 Tax=Eumeta variegata TaxID=151549 RepID=A0A4C1XMC0_EUMVA|nr:hypothetical protein EVAR_35319_1 [Eumeta japonica]
MSFTHYELLSSGKTIDSYLYCQQLMTLKQEIAQQPPESINTKSGVSHHDNVRPYTTLATRQILKDFVLAPSHSRQPRPSSGAAPPYLKVSRRNFEGYSVNYKLVGST